EQLPGGGLRLAPRDVRDLGLARPRRPGLEPGLRRYELDVDGHLSASRGPLAAQRFAEPRAAPEARGTRCFFALIGLTLQRSYFFRGVLACSATGGAAEKRTRPGGSAAASNPFGVCSGRGWRPWRTVACRRRCSGPTRPAATGTCPPTGAAAPCPAPTTTPSSTCRPPSPSPTTPAPTRSAVSPATTPSLS